MPTGHAMIKARIGGDDTHYRAPFPPWTSTLSPSRKRPFRESRSGLELVPGFGGEVRSNTHTEIKIPAVAPSTELWDDCDMFVR